jgi:hypothetical protein
MKEIMFAMNGELVAVIYLNCVCLLIHLGLTSHVIYR